MACITASTVAWVTPLAKVRVSVPPELRVTMPVVLPFQVKALPSVSGPSSPDGLKTSLALAPPWRASVMLLPP